MSFLFNKFALRIFPNAPTGEWNSLRKSRRKLNMFPEQIHDVFVKEIKTPAVFRGRFRFFEDGQTYFKA